MRTESIQAFVWLSLHPLSFVIPSSSPMFHFVFHSLCVCVDVGRRGLLIVFKNQDDFCFFNVVLSFTQLFSHVIYPVIKILRSALRVSYQAISSVWRFSRVCAGNSQESTLKYSLQGPLGIREQTWNPSNILSWQNFTWWSEKKNEKPYAFDKIYLIKLEDPV